MCWTHLFHRYLVKISFIVFSRVRRKKQNTTSNRHMHAQHRNRSEKKRKPPTTLNWTHEQTIDHSLDHYLSLTLTLKIAHFRMNINISIWSSAFLDCHLKWNRSFKIEIISHFFFKACRNLLVVAVVFVFSRLFALIFVSKQWPVENRQLDVNLSWKINDK